MTSSQMVRTPTFWVFMVYLMLVTCGGLALINENSAGGYAIIMGAGAAAFGAGSGRRWRQRRAVEAEALYAGPHHDRRAACRP